MSYQVLARKWRPKNFETLVGQEHVLRVLTHALEEERLHHAYLFTGTRGTGKTTIARILAKCLNCETGITAHPCGTCSACQEIDTGRFVDLIEVDAASQTKVEDTRGLLNNVQYSPTRGRFKIYLIDEVHMLSGHSFNALLKTLEEPPAHVKFLLATTDPQKLPITVLSRCLQLHLKNLPTEKIDQYLQFILKEEKIETENAATRLIARAAKGSMRDALSVLDQAISFGKGAIKTHDVASMLGVIEQRYIADLLEALAKQDAAQILKITQQMAEQAVDFVAALEELIAWLHALTIEQLIPQSPLLIDADAKLISQYSQSFTPETIQLYYQIAVLARRDLPWTGDIRVGFEMALLRMLAFRPEEAAQKIAHVQTQRTITTPTQKAMAPSRPIITDTLDWPTLLSQLSLSGMVYALASNCALKSFTQNTLILILDSAHAALLNDKLKARLNEALDQHFNQKITLQIQVEKSKAETPALKVKNQKEADHQAAIETVEQDPAVQALIKQLDVTLEPKLIKSQSNLPE